VEKRFKQHQRHAKVGNNRHLYTAMRKYGESIVLTVLHELDNEACMLVENMYRPAAHIGWNHGVGGDNPTLGFKHTDEFKAKISAIKKGHVASDETRKKMSDSKMGITRPKEFSDKISAIHKGRKFTEETKLKMSAAKLGKVLSEETKIRMSETARNRSTFPWNHVAAKRDVWVNADAIYLVYVQNTSHSHIAKQLGYEYSKITCMFKMFKSGWVPSEDVEWVLFKQEYESSRQGMPTQEASHKCNILI
jgi:hypothetical protein